MSMVKVPSADWSGRSKKHDREGAMPFPAGDDLGLK